MGLLKKLIMFKGASSLANTLTKKDSKKWISSKFDKEKKKANPFSRLALGLFVAGASAHLLNKNKDEVKKGVDRVKDKAQRAKDDFEDILNGSEELK